jgi:hypothetical protein
MGYVYHTGTDMHVSNILSTGGLTLDTNQIIRFQISVNGVIADGAGNEIGWKDTPLNGQSGSYLATNADRGKCIVMATAGTTMTIPQAGAGTAQGMNPGCMVCVFNNSSGNITLGRDGATTALLWGAGASKVEGPRTLAATGFATFWLAGGATWLVSGTGIS